jgi:hypothetical protein
MTFLRLRCVFAILTIVSNSTLVKSGMLALCLSLVLSSLYCSALLPDAARRNAIKNEDHETRTW